MMHPTATPRNRAMAFALVLLMATTPLLAMSEPADAVLVEGVVGATLPLEWTFPGHGGNATFDLSLPGGSYVEDARLTLAGAAYEGALEVGQSIGDWRSLPLPVESGFDTSGDALDITDADAYVGVAGPDLANSSTTQGVDVTDSVRLAPTSPRFTASGGGTWRFYKELDISLNLGTAVYDAFTFAKVELPRGACKDWRELRILDWLGLEVPFQIAGAIEDSASGSYVSVDLMFPSDLPALGSNTYRLYYGNPKALDPGYPPIILSSEEWPYASTGDPGFRTNWSSLAWTGGMGAGSASAGILDIPSMGRSLSQKTTASQARTYSQVWTSRGKPLSDFQLELMFGNMTLSGPLRSAGYWGIDFRVTGTDCYRLIYYDSNENLTDPKLQLWRVATTRHLETASTPSDNWRLLDERFANLSGSGAFFVLIRAQGKSLRVYFNDVDRPIIDVTDADLAQGTIGTFQGAKGVPLVPNPTTVTGAYGTMVVVSTAVNLTSKFPMIVPGEQRTQHVSVGEVRSMVWELPGARDAVLDVDIATPPGTHYSVSVLAPDDSLRLDGLHDGSALPEGVLDGGFRLAIKLTTDLDWTTPKLRGWGVGYRAPMHAESNSTVVDLLGAKAGEGGLRLAPTRDSWYKHDSAVIKPGNLPADSAGVEMGCWVPHGDGWRVYYTGTDRFNHRSICMATTDDGLAFRDFRSVIPVHAAGDTWHVESMSPSVLRGDEVWLMYFIGRDGAPGSVGLALSGNGVEWTELRTAALKPTGQPGDLDKDSIEDVFVLYDMPTATLHMYYTGRPDNASEKSYILHATSTGAQPWVRRSSSPVLSPSTVASDWDTGFVADPWVVVTEGGGLVMYYRGGVPGKPPAVGVATSPNWLDFKKSAANPVLVPRLGAVTDDMLGITGVLAIEDGRDRYYMLYSAVGSDWARRAFVADSAHVRSGEVTGPVLDLRRAPRAVGPLNADAALPAGTSVTYMVRASDDPRAFPDWVEVEDNTTMPQGIAPARYLQLKVVLSTASPDVTPTLRAVHEGWRSDVREAALTVPTDVEADLVAVTMHVDGTVPDGLVIEGTNDGTGWVALEDGVRTAFPGEGLSFAYRLAILPRPGDAMALIHLNFSLGRTSLPSDIYLDIGADGGRDWEHAPVLEGEEEVDITTALRGHLDPPEVRPYDWTEGTTISHSVRIEVGTATAGRLSLADVRIELDTRPRVTARTPEPYNVHVDEGGPVHFEVTTEEDDGDALTYGWSVNGTTLAGEGGSLTYTPPTGPKWSAPVQVVLLVSDGRFSVRTNWTLHVNETPVPPPQNRPPQLTSWKPVDAGVSMKENRSATFEAFANDPDGGPLTLAFRWYLNDTLQPAATRKDFTFSPGYDGAGTYELRVEAFDGAAGVNHTWSLTVSDAQPPTPPPPDGDGDGAEGWPAWMMPSLILLIIIAAVAAAAIAMRRRGAPGGARQATGPEPPVEADLGAVALEAATPAEAPAPPAPAPGAAQPTTGSLQRGVSARPAAKRAAAMGAAAAAPLAPLPIADMERDRMFVVEEVYVIYNDGRLVHHACRDEARCGVDTDLFGGMFTAIQQFIQDSMGGASGTNAQAVGRLDYGENVILVERGKHLFLAVIIYGDDRGVLRDAMRDTLNRIEGAHAGVIERWSGDTSQLAGVAAIVAPLLALTADLTRDTIAARTTETGVKMLSEVEFYQGYVRLKVAVRNDTKSVITNVAVDISYDTNVLRVQRIMPEYETHGTKVMLSTLSPREKKTVAYYLDPLICQESDIDGTTTYKDAAGVFKTVTMKRRRADIVCPIFFTEENANTAMLKRLVHEELKEQDSKLFAIPKILTAKDAFALAKQVVRNHDVRFVREFVEEQPAYRAEAWFYGVTKVKKSKMVIRASVWDDPKNVEFSVASNRMEAITGLLAELGQNLNEALKERYMGRAKVTPIMDEGEREAVKGMGLLMDKWSESEAQAGETEQA